MQQHECYYQIDKWQCTSCAKVPANENQFYVLAPALAKNNDGFHSESFHGLYELESNNFWFRSRNELIVWAIKKYFPHFQSLLEIGCGTGYVLSGLNEAFPNVKLYGSDIYTLALEFASMRLPEATLFQMDATSIPFKEQFELICAFDVLEHIEEDELTLKNIYHALRPGGGVIFTVPQHPFLWSVQDDYACHKRRYIANELKTKLLNAGFRIKKMTSFVSFLLPLMIISRYKEKKSSQVFNPKKELQMNPLINFLLETVMSFERMIIKSHITLPLGGSLLVVAERLE